MSPANHGGGRILPKPRGGNSLLDPESGSCPKETFHNGGLNMVAELQGALFGTRLWSQLSKTRVVADALVLVILHLIFAPAIAYSVDTAILNAVPTGDVVTRDDSIENCADNPTAPQKDKGSILAPGSGFSGETDQPESQDSGDGDDAKAIARWDVVPYQVFNKTMNVGVIAFHINDIKKVSFSVDGGPWKDVHSMKLNPETNVVEYWVTLRASDFSDGPVEIRAIAYPTRGVPRVLQGKVPLVPNSNTATTNGEHSMWLFANSGETFKSSQFFVSPSRGEDTNTGDADHPVKSLSRALSLASVHDGSTIILTEAGEYHPDRKAATDSKNTQWITVKRGEGLAREDVMIVGAERRERLMPKITRLRWQGLTFRPDKYWYVNEFYTTTEYSQWYDDCLVKTPELEIIVPSLNTEVVCPWRGNVYATNSRVDTYVYGFTGVLLARDCVVKDVLDAYQRSQLVVNCSVERARAESVSAQHHPDLYQSWGDMKNIIVYGMKGDDIDGMQILFINQPLAVGPDMTDAAFVDFHVKTYDKWGGPPFSQLQGPINNILFKNVKIPNQKILFRKDLRTTTEFLVPRNVVFQDCHFHNKVTFRSVPRGVTVKDSGQNPSTPRAAPVPASAEKPQATAPVKKPKPAQPLQAPQKP